MTRAGYFSRVPKQSEAVMAVHRSLDALPRGRWLLAVSGGRDSMVLLHAMAERRGRELAAVATFDHGTGSAARRAAALVEQTALARELPVVVGSAVPSPTAADAARGEANREARWREQRWTFLRGWAAELRATVVTAHTRDDQIETVLLRLLRGSGVRGLAGMRAPTEGERVERPLLTVPRTEVAAYAAAQRLEWIEDPSNASREFARNRARLDLLPALERVAPGFGEWCWALGERAASWRVGVAALVDELGVTRAGPDAVALDAKRVQGLGPAEWAVLWPELASRCGLAMDRRGIERASEWAPHAASGAEIQLAGGGRIGRTRGTFVVYCRPQ